MMTQPIRIFENLESPTTPAGGNTKTVLTLEESRLLEMRARTARAQALGEGIGEMAIWLRSAWHRLVDRIKADFRIRTAEAQLNRMTDRELADLGLTRSEIAYAIRQSVHGVAPEIQGEGHAVQAANENLRRAA